MAKKLSEGRKAGSGRKPGTAKTLAEGRKVGSGRKKGSVSKTLASGRKVGSGRKKSYKSEQQGLVDEVQLNKSVNQHQRNGVNEEDDDEEEDEVLKQNININGLFHENQYNSQIRPFQISNEKQTKDHHILYPQMSTFINNQSLPNSIHHNLTQYPNSIQHNQTQDSNQFRIHDLSRILINDLGNGKPNFNNPVLPFHEASTEREIK